MSRSALLRLSELRALHQLVGKCRELGDDPILWRRHLLAGAARLAGAGFCVSGEVGDAKRPSRYDQGTVDLGADNGFDRAGWLRSLKEFRTDAFFNPHMNATFDRVPPGVVLPRADLVPDREWYTSFCYQICLRTLGADASIFCMMPIPGAPDDYNVLYFLRPIGERDFNGRQRAIAAEAMALVAPLLGGALARLHEPAPSDLTPRLRQVLRCLLEGDSDKQIAARLTISPYTVNQYTKDLYRRPLRRDRPIRTARPMGPPRLGRQIRLGRRPWVARSRGLRRWLSAWRKQAAADQPEFGFWHAIPISGCFEPHRFPGLQS